MKNILLELWRGNVAPSENLQMDQSYKDKLRLLIEDEEYLRPLLDDKGQEILEHFGVVHYDLHARNAETAFIKGFRLGVRLLLEALEDT